jgi:hypothetical protein
MHRPEFRTVISRAVFLVSGPMIGFGRMIQVDVIRNLFSPEKKIWMFAAA